MVNYLNRSNPDKIKVLIVEDDYQHVELLTEYLNLVGGFSIEWVKTIAKFWTWIETNIPDIIILDNVLPDGVGIEAMQSLRDKGVDIPIIMVTGMGDEKLAVRAMQLGAVDYLVKGANYLPTLPIFIGKVVNEYQAQAAHHKSLDQTRYQALLLNNVRDAVVVWDNDGVITYINPAAERMFGIRPADCLGNSVFQVYFPLFSPLPEIPKIGIANGHEVERCLSFSAKQLWISSQLSILTDSSGEGKLIGYMDVSRDITERKLMETRIRTAQMQLAESSRQAAIGDLASGIAHHINNPLTTIIAEAQMLLNKIGAEHPIYESIKAIEQAGWRVQKAVQLLLDFSKPPSNKFEELSINQTVKIALELIEGQIKSGGTRLNIDLEDKLPKIYGNPKKLTALWTNLLILARDGAEDELPHTINLRSGQDGDTIFVEFHDDGRIIPAEDIQNILEPDFFRSLGGRGDGIEINVCNEIVRQHHAKMQIVSDPVRGTIFRVNIPLEVMHEAI